MKLKIKLLFVFLLIMCLSFNSHAQIVEGVDLSSISQEEIDRLVNMSAEEYDQLDIFSSSKRPEKVKEVAGSVYVLKSKDIKKAGITSIPEALRMVPGVQVSRTTANSWAISIRGFNRQFSNKLLVLIDGRTVYTPLFSGIFWDVQDYPIDDIDRIEVIRGPGGTLWGPNAVNGVINIISKEARKTQSSYAKTTIGSHENAVEARTAFRTDDFDYYRIYANHKEFSDFKRVGVQRSNDDNWHKGQAGFRMESVYNKFTLQGDFYSGRRNSDLQMPTSSFPFTRNEDLGEDFSGGNLMLKWNIPIGDVQSTLQTYVDYTYRDTLPILEQEIITYDFDWQFEYNTGRHNLTSGIGNRVINDNLGNTAHLAYRPESTNFNIFNTFIQDKISVIEDKLYLILGSKFDYNDFTNFEMQPNARVLYHINEDHSIWGAISRAIRLPSRGENSFERFAPAGLPYGLALIEGNPAYESENLNAYELGFRSNVKSNVYFETSFYYNDYSDLRTIDFNRMSGGSQILRINNNGFGETYGFDSFAIWGIKENWDLKLGYSFIKQNMHTHIGSTDTGLARDENRSPNFQYNLISNYRFSNQISMNNALYFYDDIIYYTGAGAKRYIESHTRFDTSLMYNPTDKIEVSLTGQNLFDDNHQEFDEIIYSTASEIPRMALLQVKYKF
ncbi:MAG: TonB-dependent receptor [Rickettsiales bacterium]|nr:TonB-dependent receptor [Rickettsiales bacterium]